MKAVVNAPPLIALARVDQLALLNQLFDEVLVPPAVYQEVTVQGVNLPGAALVMQSDWIRVQAPVTPPTIEPLLLAQDVQPAQVVIDERIGRRVAQALRIPLTGTLGVLLAAFRAELLTKQQASDAAHEMVAKGIRIGTPLLAWFEREINQ
jgi:predicted nucleic acid-binding protein